MLENIESLEYIGHVAIFYVPINKLNLTFKDETAKSMLEKFLLENFNAFTVEISDTLGFWREHKKSELFHDKNARYEVSFDGKHKVEEFVHYLSHFCFLIQEKAIYLTMGYKSYLVYPRETT